VTRSDIIDLNDGQPPSIGIISAQRRSNCYPLSPRFARTLSLFAGQKATAVAFPHPRSGGGGSPERSDGETEGGLLRYMLFQA